MEVRTLAEAIQRYGREAYLLSVAPDGPHTSSVTIYFRDGSVFCALGPSASKNIAREPNVSLFWPPLAPGGYAMILNGTASLGGQATGFTTAEIAITKSVLHRSGPKPADSDGPCGSDCRRLTR